MHALLLACLASCGTTTDSGTDAPATSAAEQAAVSAQLPVGKRDVERSSVQEGVREGVRLSGRWEEIAGSQLANHVPHPVPPGVAGLNGIMQNWSGAVFDSRRNRLVIWGGGHTGYAGNELYGFDVIARRWTRIWGPTPNAQIPLHGSEEVYGDGNPAARHTYDNIVYDPVADALWSNGGAPWRLGGPTIATWRFSFKQGRWERLADGPLRNIFSQTAYDPVERLIIKRENHGVHYYDPASDQWRTVAEGLRTHWYMNGELHPEERKLVMVGHDRFEIYDLERKRVSDETTSGATGILAAKAPGLAYHPPSGTIVGWGSDDRQLYQLHIDGQAYHWSLVEVLPGGALPGSPGRNGTYGRFRYVPSIDAFVLVNTAETNVFLFHVQ